MRMAKASQKDLDCALLIMHQLGDLERGDMPRTGHGEEDPIWPETDPEWYPRGFDQDDDEHCREALKRILAVFCKREHGGSLMRVIGGMHCVMENGVFDPAQEHLAWHPDLLPAIEAREARAKTSELPQADGKEAP